MKNKNGVIFLLLASCFLLAVFPSFAQAPIFSEPYQLEIREDVSFDPETLNFVNDILFTEGDPVVKIFDAEGKETDINVDDYIVSPRGELSAGECDAFISFNKADPSQMSEETKDEFCGRTTKLLFADVANDGEAVKNSSNESDPYIDGFPFADMRITGSAPIYRNDQFVGVAVSQYKPLLSMKTPLGYGIDLFTFKEVDGKKKLAKRSMNGGWQQATGKCIGNDIEDPAKMAAKGCYGDYWPIGIVSADMNSDGISDLLLINRGLLPDKEHSFVTLYLGKEPSKDDKEFSFANLFSYDTIAQIGKEPTFAVASSDGKSVYVATEDGINIISWMNNGLSSGKFSITEKPEGLEPAMRPYQIAQFGKSGEQGTLAVTWAKVVDVEAQKIEFYNKFSVYSLSKDSAGNWKAQAEHIGAPSVSSSSDSDAVVNDAKLSALAFSPEISEGDKVSPALLWVGEQNVRDGNIYAHAFPIVNGMPDTLSVLTVRVNGPDMSYLEEGKDGGGVKQIKVDRHGNSAFVLGYPEIYADMIVTKPPEDHCKNNVQDADETGIDCGGADCPPCATIVSKQKCKAKNTEQGIGGAFWTEWADIEGVEFVGEPYKDSQGHTCYENDIDCDGFIDSFNKDNKLYYCDPCEPVEKCKTLKQHCESSFNKTFEDVPPACKPPAAGGEHPPAEECPPLKDKIEKLVLPSICPVTPGACYVNDLDCDGYTDDQGNACEFQWNNPPKCVESDNKKCGGTNLTKCDYKEPYAIWSQTYNSSTGQANPKEFPCIQAIANCCKFKPKETCSEKAEQPPSDTMPVITSLPGPKFNYIPPASCTADADNDGICDDKDNCPPNKKGVKCYGDEASGHGDQCYNPSQQDIDGDGIGDACDPCVCEYCSVAVIPMGPDVQFGASLTKEARAKSEWVHVNGKESELPGSPTICASGPCGCLEKDSSGNCAKWPVCYCVDPDGDRICSPELGTDAGGKPKFDNCPFADNYDQKDLDTDKVGDKCEDVDTDGDEVPDSKDLCKFIPKTYQLDGDNDGIGAECDSCKGIPAPCSDDDCADKIGKDQDGDGIDDNCDNIDLWEQYTPPPQSSNFKFDLSLISTAHASENSFFKKIFGGGEIKDKGAVTVLLNKGLAPAPEIPQLSDCFVDVGRIAGKSAAADEQGQPLDRFITSLNDKAREIVRAGIKKESGIDVALNDVHTDFFIGELGGHFNARCALSGPPVVSDANVYEAVPWTLHQIGGMPVDPKNWGVTNYRPGLPPFESEYEAKNGKKIKVSRDELLKEARTQLVSTSEIVTEADFPLPSIVSSGAIQLSLADDKAFAQDGQNPLLNLASTDVFLGADNVQGALMRIRATPVPNPGQVAANLAQLSISADLSKWAGGGIIYEFEGMSASDLCGWGHPELCAPRIDTRNINPDAVLNKIQTCVDGIVSEPALSVSYKQVALCLSTEPPEGTVFYDSTGWLLTKYVISQKSAAGADFVEIPLFTVPISYSAAGGGWGCSLTK